MANVDPELQAYLDAIREAWRPWVLAVVYHRFEWVDRLLAQGPPPVSIECGVKRG